MRIERKIWLEENGRVLFGEGRVELLKAIADNGSLAAAARTLGMSYRAAWGRLKASEERLGFDLVVRGPDKRQGMNLTPRAHELLERFDELIRTTDDCLAGAEEQWRLLIGRARDEAGNKED